MNRADVLVPVDPTRAGKSLKDQNRWQLWIVLAANTLFLYGIVQSNAIRVGGLRALFADTQNLLPVAFALTITAVINGVLSVSMKNRLVFLRWNCALPGHRAFSQYAKIDPRIEPADLPRLCGGAVPTEAIDQNRVWYQIYKSIENDPAVRQVHRDFLLLRDYTGISALFMACYGLIGLYAIPSLRIALLYVLILIAQYMLVRQAASNYGIEFVTTVLARKGGWKKTATSRKRKLKDTPELLD
jgi:hypothetical protein